MNTVRVLFGIFAFLFVVNSTNVLATQPVQLQKSFSQNSELTRDAVIYTNINTADARILRKIKGVGKKKSEAIVKYRNKNGLFKSVDDLLKVKCRGINKKWLDKISKVLTV